MRGMSQLPEAMKTTPMGPPTKASQGASAAPGGMRPPTTSPITVSTAKPTMWFQKDAMSGEFDRLSRPLIWRLSATKTPPVKAMAIQTIMPFSRQG